MAGWGLGTRVVICLSLAEGCQALQLLFAQVYFVIQLVLLNDKR